MSSRFDDDYPGLYTGADEPLFSFGFTISYLVLALIGYVISAYLLSRIFKKAGVAETWAAWVPVYNTWKLLELGGQKGYWAVLMFVPIVNIVALVFLLIAMYHVGLGFGKESWFVLLAIFIPIIWLGILALDNSTWKGAAAPVAPGSDSTPPAAAA